MTLMPVELQDRFSLNKDRIFLNGTQALIRLCLMQAEYDRRAGLNTAGYISGYRGSPLGGLDQQFSRAKEQLQSSNVVFEPGLNEDLAATAIWGAQQAQLHGEGRFDGVFCIWYGKGPGVDRSGDVFRHANLAGTSPHGGVIALMGDDHTCESSTTAHQSEFALMDAMIPVLNPANLEEIIAYGLHAWALSRFAGVWCGLKCVKDNIESTASINAGMERFSALTPADTVLPAGGLNIRRNDHPVEQEARLHRYKLQAVHAYVRHNALDQVTLGSVQDAKVGIVSTGKSYMDSLQALELLGIDHDNARQYGICLYKVAMPWPLEPTALEAFASKLDLVIVVEEKRGLIEEQIKSILYGKSNAPVVIGKQDERGNTLFQSQAALNPVQIAEAFATRLSANSSPAVELQNAAEQLGTILTQERTALSLERKPYFCAGCPHNSSTVIPEGARAYAGIGCHWMVQFMGRNTEGYTHMGGEGANWIGESKFSQREHIFQNIGDGTFNHSGIMAIRAAIASNTRMTFKVLFNDAVAMTGGQLNDGGLDVYAIAHQVVAAGAVRTSLVSDQPEKINKALLPRDVSVSHRDQLEDVQNELAKLSGVSVLIYEQTCASEKRRRRKRGLMPEAPQRVFINDAVCEGCGDCGVQSNCVAIVPLETPLGRKRAIDQSNCNNDLSCVDGFCPSFVTVTGSELFKPAPVSHEIPLPSEPTAIPSLTQPYAIALCGVGGNGVVTVAALLGMAAHLEGKGCGIIDMAGLAQKGGAVVSHIKLSATPEEISAIRIAPGQADLLLGCDLLVSSGESVMKILKPECQAVVNTYEKMPGAFTSEPDLNLPVDIMRHRLRSALGEESILFVNASDIAHALLGDSIAANLFILGAAYQKGLIPLTIEGLNKAIELNGVAVEFNQNALRWGRVWVENESLVKEHCQAYQQASANRDHDSVDQNNLDQVIEHRYQLLCQYQSKSYANVFRELINKVRAVDDTPQSKLTFAVARNSSKLRAYKDEYEVGRLYSDGDFKKKLQKQFSGDYRVSVHLAPTWLNWRPSQSSAGRKREFGSWIFHVFLALSKLKFLRGTFADPFGWSAERRIERRLIREYEALLVEIVNNYERINVAVAQELAELPDIVRGFGHIKLANIEKYQSQRENLMNRLYDQSGAQQSPVRNGSDDTGTEVA